MAPAQGRAPGASRRARETQRRLARSSRTARNHLIVTVGLGLATTFLIIAQATLLAKVIAGVFLGGDDLGDVAGLLGWLVAISVARGLVGAGFESSGRFGASKVMAELRSRLAEHLLLSRPGGLQRESSGELVTSAVDGVEALENYFARYQPQLVLAVTVPVAILVWVLPYDWKAAAILAVTAPLIPLFMVLIGRLTENRTRDRWQLMSRLSAHFVDIVGGLETLRANGRADSQADSIARVGEQYRRETMGVLRIGFLSALVLELLAMVAVAMVAVTIGVQLAGGHMTLVAGLTILLLAPEFYMPLRQLGNQFHASVDGMAAAERVFEVLDQPASVEAPPAPSPAPDPARGPIEFSRVGFGYEGRATLFTDLDLVIEPGETVAMVGPSGGGKSTLVSLLLRTAEPAGGAISCDGVDLSGVDPRAWRRRVTWVPQRPTIFAGTVAENLRLFDPDAETEALREAVRMTGLEQLVEQLPDGLSTVVGEGGRGLSVGQCQRIAVARALLSPAPLVVFDEPTAHLDGETERRVVAALDRLIAGRTALVVSHRDRPVLSADRVLRLRDGSLSEVRPDLKGAPA
jgi:ATP-binding cassette subfamily C protein CydCD